MSVSYRKIVLTAAGSISPPWGWHTKKSFFYAGEVWDSPKFVIVLLDLTLGYRIHLSPNVTILPRIGLERRAIMTPFLHGREGALRRAQEDLHRAGAQLRGDRRSDPREPVPLLRGVPRSLHRFCLGQDLRRCGGGLLDRGEALRGGTPHLRGHGLLRALPQGNDPERDQRQELVRGFLLPEEPLPLAVGAQGRTRQRRG